MWEFSMVKCVGQEVFHFVSYFFSRLFLPKKFILVSVDLVFLLLEGMIWIKIHIQVTPSIGFTHQKTLLSN